MNCHLDSAQGAGMNKHKAISVASHSVNCITAVLLLMSFSASAAGLHQDINHIERNSLNNIGGIISVNTAAGDNNIQANSKSIAIGKNVQAFNKSQLTTQSFNNNGTASVRIEANTLQNAHGLISINQVAGSNNAQLNELTIALGENLQLVSDISLSSRVISKNNSTDDSSNKHSVYLDKDSLKGATGTIQINQIAGNGNIAINRVSMPIQ